MKNFMVATLIVAFSLALGGCSSLGGGYTQIEGSSLGGLFTRYDNVFTIINSSSMSFSVLANGECVAVLSPGETHTLNLWGGYSNWSTSRTYSIAVKMEKSPYRSTFRPVTATTYQQYAETWSVTDADFGIF